MLSPGDVSTCWRRWCRPPDGAVAGDGPALDGQLLADDIGGTTLISGLVSPMVSAGIDCLQPQGAAKQAGTCRSP